MSKKHASDNFFDYQFLELYIALLKKENKNLVISTNELETTLVSFYNNDEYKPLFHGLDMVDEANLEYVDTVSYGKNWSVVGFQKVKIVGQ